MKTVYEVQLNTHEDKWVVDSTFNSKEHAYSQARRATREHKGELMFRVVEREVVANKPYKVQAFNGTIWSWYFDFETKEEAAEFIMHELKSGSEYGFRIRKKRAKSNS